MTPEEQRIAIAEVCGWMKFWQPTGEDEGMGHREWHIGNTNVRSLPDYLHDLNAMLEAEKMLTEKQVAFYLTKLLQVCYQTGEDRDMIACMQDKLPFATATQRAEAFLRTIGKWKD